MNNLIQIQNQIKERRKELNRLVEEHIQFEQQFAEAVNKEAETVFRK